MALVKDWWWHAFHHSIAMMCLSAPISCGKRKSLYFGSSYSARDRKEWGKYVIASDPQIDNHVRFCGCHVVHDGYEFSRHDKIKRICEFYKDQEYKPYLRVCYHSNTGKNCGVCEKCVRAIVSILLIGEDPRPYGFQYHEEDLAQCFAAGLQEKARAKKYACLSLYSDVQTAYRDKYSIEEVPPVLRTFYEIDLETLVDFLHVPNNECIAMEAAFKKAQERLYWEIGQLKYKLEKSEQLNGILMSRVEGASETDDSPKMPEHDLHMLEDANRVLEERLRSMEQSTSWRITKPLRCAGELLSRAKHSLLDR